MGNVLLLSPTDSDAATLAASSAVSTLPVANLQTIQPQKKWRSGGTTESITIQAASALVWNAACLVGHNLTSAATIRVRGGTTAGNVTAAPTVDTGAVSAWPATGKPTVANWPNYLSLVTWATPIALQYWRLDIADAGNAAGYLEAGRLVIGKSWQPAFNFDGTGSPIAFDTMDTQTKTAFGYLYTSRGPQSPARMFNLQISGTDQRDVLDGISEIQRLRGNWGDVICCLDPTATTDFHRYSLQGVFVAKPDYPIYQQFGSDGAAMYGAKIQLNELL